MKKYFPLFSVFFVSTILWSCETRSKPSVDEQFIDLSAMDSSVKPGDNFYMYVNGKWMQNTSIPSTENAMSTWKTMDDHVEAEMHRIIDSVAKGGFKKGSLEQIVGDFFRSGMDTVTIEKLGYDPVKPVLSEINALRNVKDLMAFEAEQTPAGDNALIGFYVSEDDKNSNQNIANFYQTGLGMPDRDYYFKEDSTTTEIQHAYQKYIREIFMLTGDDSITATKKMQAVYDLEKEIAGSQLNNTAVRDPQNNYHKMALVDLEKKMPMIGWKKLFDNLGLRVDSVNLQQPGYYQKLNELLKSIPMSTWKAYLRLNAIDAQELSSPFENAIFEFNKTLSGQEKMKSRWKRIYKQTNLNLGDAVGKLFVNKYFTEEDKKRMLGMVKNLQKAFEMRIKNLDWMSDSTKNIAIDKLRSYIIKIGYPDEWRDYSKLKIDAKKYYENRIACSKNEYQFNLDKLGKPVDKSDWNGLTPQTVDAYNMGSKGIIFPAGILQSPMFNPSADDAVNYGAIGTLIGHEMTHGFDDRGAQYDKEGNLRNWWNKVDSAKFSYKTKQVINQFNGYTMLDTLHVKGELTVSENIADLGGVNIAYEAFKLTTQGSDSVKIDGFSPDQRFFISYARIWKVKEKPEHIRYRINADGHAPWIYRVNGPLSNFTPFYTAFNLVPSNKMYKADSQRIVIW
jgi:putative endopeptidase